PAAFSWAPGLGFSGAVFAFFGFVVVFYPVVGVLALILTSIASSLLTAALNPVSIQTATEEIVRPSWANVALEAHALGFLLGFGLAVIYARRYRYPIDRARVAFAVLAFGLLNGLWILSVSDGTEFVLYRGIGVGVVVLLSLGLTSTATHLQRGPVLSLSDLSLRRLVASTYLTVPILVFLIGGVWFMAMFSALGFVDQPDGVEVGDYTVFYDDEAEVDLAPPFDEMLTENVSFEGVLVESESRSLHMTAMSDSDLRDGGGVVRVGDVGWTREIDVERTGMTTATSESTYSVVLEEAKSNQSTSYDSGPADTGTSLDGWDVELESRGDVNTAVLDDGDVRHAVVLDERRTSSHGFEFQVVDDEVRVSRGDDRAVLGQVD
ncbi:MAG: hypothetical protein ACOCT0_04335, partial [Halobacteriota archaeon]